MAICKHLKPVFSYCELDERLCDRRLETVKDKCPKLTKATEPALAATVPGNKPPGDAKGHFIKKEVK